MALVSCRECGAQVSTEASTCPHCGIGTPAVAPLDASGMPVAPALATQVKDTSAIDFRSPLTYLIILATLAVLGAGLYAYEHFLGGVEADGEQVEASIVDRFHDIAGNVTLTATCPSTVRLRKGKIVDCTLERSDTGARTQVFITGIDNSGHYQMQVADPSVLIGTP